VVCARCGHQNQPDARFCSSCGASLEEVDENTQTLHAVEAADAEDELANYLEGLPPGVGLLVFLDDITVSRRHVVLDRTEGGYVLRDVGSLNGTYVNRERADKASLHHGDEVQIGRYRLNFVLGDEHRAPDLRDA
jgi:FHA domain/zinc-ribbon domain